MIRLGGIERIFPVGDEAVHALRRYADSLNLDPERLAELDRRLADMHRLARKHRVQPDALAGLLEQFQARLAELAAGDDLDALQAAEDAAFAHYQAEAGQLGALRRKAAAALSKQVTAAMHELALAGGNLDIVLLPASEPRAAILDFPISADVLHSSRHARIPHRPHTDISSTHAQVAI